MGRITLCEGILGKKKSDRIDIKYDCRFILQILVAAAPFLTGVFEEYISSIVAVVLLGLIILCTIKNGFFIVKREPLLITAAVVELFFLLSPVWAVDKGMAVMGAVKFLPLPLFVLLLQQSVKTDASDCLKFVPHSGVIMTVLSFILSRIPALSSYMLVSGRLAGFFQYSNTFAVFLLAGIILLMFRRERKIIDYIASVILACGIFLSGSRTVFILFIAAAILFVITEKNRKIKIFAIGAVGLMVALTVVYAAVTGNYEVIGRYLTSSLKSSTFVGRFLYFSDAIPQIIRHPLGFGYYGYRSVQGSFQTGVYSVVHIHNDLLQILLDIGWLPAAAAIWAVVCFFRRKPSLRIAAAASAIMLHSLFDFDLQFVSIDLILLAMLFANDEKYKTKILKKNAVTAAAAVIGCAALYFGTADALSYFHKDEAAASLYPGYTDSLVVMLQKADTMEEYDALSDRILRLNGSCSLAYSAKARVAFSQGNITAMMDYKNKAIALSRYSLPEYLDYIDMLRIGASMYLSNGDSASAEYCIREILSIPARLNEVAAGTSDLGLMIDDKPELELPDEYKAFINELVGV